MFFPFLHCTFRSKSIRIRHKFSAFCSLFFPPSGNSTGCDPFFSHETWCLRDYSCPACCVATFTGSAIHRSTAQMLLFFSSYCILQLEIYTACLVSDITCSLPLCVAHRLLCAITVALRMRRVTYTLSINNNARKHLRHAGFVSRVQKSMPQLKACLPPSCADVFF